MSGDPLADIPSLSFSRQRSQTASRSASPAAGSSSRPALFHDVPSATAARSSGLPARQSEGTASFENGQPVMYDQHVGFLHRQPHGFHGGLLPPHFHPQQHGDLQAIMPPQPMSTTPAHTEFRTTFYNPYEIRHRRRTTPTQLSVLEREFARNPKPGTDRRKEIAEELDMTVRSVQVWFQNRRAKAKNQRLKAMSSGEVSGTDGNSGEDIGTLDQPMDQSSSSLADVAMQEFLAPLSLPKDDDLLCGQQHDVASDVSPVAETSDIAPEQGMPAAVKRSKGRSQQRDLKINIDSHVNWLTGHASSAPPPLFGNHSSLALLTPPESTQPGGVASAKAGTETLEDRGRAQSAPGAHYLSYRDQSGDSAGETPTTAAFFTPLSSLSFQDCSAMQQLQASSCQGEDGGSAHSSRPSSFAFQFPDTAGDLFNAGSGSGYSFFGPRRNSCPTDFINSFVGMRFQGEDGTAKYALETIVEDEPGESDDAPLTMHASSPDANPSASLSHQKTEHPSSSGTRALTILPDTSLYHAQAAPYTAPMEPIAGYRRGSEPSYLYSNGPVHGPLSAQQFLTGPYARGPQSHMQRRSSLGLRSRAPGNRQQHQRLVQMSSASTSPGAPLHRAMSLDAFAWERLHMNSMRGGSGPMPAMPSSMASGGLGSHPMSLGQPHPGAPTGAIYGHEGNQSHSSLASTPSFPAQMAALPNSAFFLSNPDMHSVAAVADMMSAGHAASFASLSSGSGGGSREAKLTMPPGSAPVSTTEFELA